MMAKSLIRNRHAVNKLYNLKSQLQAVSLRIQARTTIELVQLINMVCLEPASKDVSLFHCRHKVIGLLHPSLQDDDG